MPEEKSHRLSTEGDRKVVPPLPPMTPNILAQRYASEAMRRIWSPHGRVLRERELWIAVLKAQRDAGLAVPAETITAYERVKDHIDLNSIQRREKTLRHDVKARIEEFCDLAGSQHIHKGMTSRDLTETIEQLQVLHALKLLRTQAAAALLSFSHRSKQYQSHLITARTHNVPAQFTTLGKRLAMFGEELLRGLERLNTLIETYPLRGLKGAVGTQQDLLTLFDGDAEKATTVEKRVLEHLDTPRSLNAVGQIYPRSLDYEVTSVLVQLASGPSSFAKTLRLMAGHDLAREGFAKGQVGSSAMPHKMNTRNCERLNGLHTILKGYLTMAATLTGDQWNEGDVACSVVRRVVLPDSCFATNGLLETLLTILNEMEAVPDVITRENQHSLPFLLTTTILMEAVRSGTGREDAHTIIKEHSLATVRTLRSSETADNDLIHRLAADKRLNISLETLQNLLKNTDAHIGAATTQVDRFIKAAQAWRQRCPDAIHYRPDPIL